MPSLGTVPSLSPPVQYLICRLAASLWQLDADADWGAAAGGGRDDATGASLSATDQIHLRALHLRIHHNDHNAASRHMSAEPGQHADVPYIQPKISACARRTAYTFETYSPGAVLGKRGAGGLRSTVRPLWPLNAVSNGCIVQRLCNCSSLYSLCLAFPDADTEFDFVLMRSPPVSTWGTAPPFEIMAPYCIPHSKILDPPLLFSVLSAGWFLSVASHRHRSFSFTTPAPHLIVVFFIPGLEV